MPILCPEHHARLDRLRHHRSTRLKKVSRAPSVPHRGAALGAMEFDSFGAPPPPPPPQAGAVDDFDFGECCTALPRNSRPCHGAAPGTWAREATQLAERPRKQAHAARREHSWLEPPDEAPPRSAPTQSPTCSASAREGASHPAPGTAPWPYRPPAPRACVALATYSSRPNPPALCNSRPSPRPPLPRCPACAPAAAPSRR
jgi:hypothetical protein